MTPAEEKRIADFDARIPGGVRITLVQAADEQARGLDAFCERLSSLAPQVRVDRTRDSDASHSALKILDRLKFQSIPLGGELEPFLLALSLLHGPAQDPTSALGRRTDRAPPPAFLKLFVAQQCRFCPVIARGLIPLVFKHEGIYLTVIDGLLFPDLAEAAQVRSVPTVILNDGLRWTGSPRLEEIVEVIWNSDPADLSEAALESMIQEGGASQVTRLMKGKQLIIPSFILLLCSEKWSTRLGAMVVFEELVDQDKDLASRCVEPLWDRFPSLEDPVKGDVLYLLGEAGDERMLPLLRKVRDEEAGGELEEAARDAVDRLEERISEERK